MKRLVMAMTFCATLAFAFILVNPRSAFARPCYVDDTVYFSDDSCTEQVGARYIDCQGVALDWWGSVTPYFVDFKFCCGNDSCTVEGDGCGDEGYMGCGMTCPGQCSDYGPYQ